MRGWLGYSDLAGIKDPLTHTPEPKVTIMWSLIDTEVQADREVEFSCEVLRAGGHRCPVAPPGPAAAEQQGDRGGCAGQLHPHIAAEGCDT